MKLVPGTLRLQLLTWLLVPMFGLWFVDAVFSYVTVRRAMDRVYDELLHASALAITEQVTLSGTTPTVDLPVVALELLEAGEQERVFYRVSYARSPGAPYAFLTGYDDLPPPPGPTTSRVPLVYEARYRGEVIRIAALHKTFVSEQPVTVLVQVAQTLAGRVRRTHAIVGRTLGAFVLFIVLAAALVLLGVSRGLKPLSHVSREVAGRSAADLTPLRSRHVPAEVSPLVDAINDLLARARDAIAAQRRFITDASHQLRTPLAVIQAEAELALRSDGLGSSRPAVERLRDHCRATGRLARQLLSLARAELLPERVQSMAVLDLTALAREACTAFVPDALAQQVDLGFEGTEAIGIRGQELLVREAIANLLENALRHGARPGTVTVSVRREPPETACIAVEDDGPGIPAVERDKVLERFYRIRGTQGDGCGLGLAIVHQIAQAHEATIRLLDGSQGRGLRVELHFPEAALG